VELHGREPRKVLRLDGLDRDRERVDRPFEHRHAGQDEVAVRGIVGVSRFVEIQEVHKKKRRLTGRWPSDLRKEALSVAPLGYDLRRHASMFTDAR
jgi:hypothetical protein